MARTVLLADDSVTAQNMGRRILIDAGYEVITVNNGSAALKKIHENRPDLVVLDVYMPGYGGLEVCQRLKESSETSRIPILLTVGKMEPFKADEARKARADGHIIKPFDAGELLAALAKLEDKIVPQPEYSRGRRPKSEKKSRPWQVADPAMSFDDTQTDKIAYLADVKQRHRAGEAPDNGNEAHATEASESTLAETATESVPASAAALREAPKMPRPMSVYAAEQLQELPVVAEPAPPPASQEVAAEQEPASSQAPPLESKSENAEAPAVTSEAQAVTPGEQPVASEAQPVASEKPAPTSVAPENPQVTEPDATVQGAPVSSAEPEAVVATAGEPVAPEISASSAQAEPQPTTTPEEPAQSVQSLPASRWTAENVAVTAEEASLELEREMQEAQSRADAPRMEESPAPEAPSPAVPESPQTHETAEPTDDEKNGATFAAAAAASATSSNSMAVSVPETPAEAPVAAETAAAWENWQHIRDSVMGAQSAVSESVAKIAESAPAASPSQTEQDPTETDSETEALSSIVDSVLAELKPKLMAEISKKLKK